MPHISFADLTRNPVARASSLRMCGLVLGIGSSVVIARLGGTDVKGVASAYAAANSLAFLVVNLDLAQQILRDGRNKQDLRSVPLRVVTLWIWYALLACACTFLVELAGDAVVWLAWGAFAYLISAQMGMVANALAGPVVASWGAVMQQSGMIVGALFIWSVGALTVQDVRAVVVFSYLTPLPFFIWKARQAARGLPGPYGAGAMRDSLSSLVKAGSLWQLARLTQFLMLRLDTLVVFTWLGAASAGVYSVGLATASLAGILPAQFAANTTYEATQGSVGSLGRNASSAAGTGLAACLGLGLVGYPLIHLAYGSEFDRSFVVMLATCPGVVAYGVLQVFTAHMRLVASARAVTVPSSYGLLAMVISMVILIPRLGLLGAAVGSSVGSLTAVLGVVLVARGHGTAGTADSRAMLRISK
jgi:O-antigen/teichoic acid export membrane protein